MVDFESCIAFSFNKVAKNLAEILNSQLIKKGITYSQWIAMYLINEYGEISQKDLANLMGVKEPTITGLVEKLERAGYVKRMLNQEDKRKNKLSITAQGKKINKESTRIAEDFQDACLADISESDQNILLESLKKMEKASEKWLENSISQ